MNIKLLKRVGVGNMVFEAGEILSYAVFRKYKLNEILVERKDYIYFR